MKYHPKVKCGDRGTWYVIMRPEYYLHQDGEVRRSAVSYNREGKRILSGWYKTEAEARLALYNYSGTITLKAPLVFFDTKTGEMI